MFVFLVVCWFYSHWLIFWHCRGSILSYFTLLAFQETKDWVKNSLQFIFLFWYFHIGKHLEEIYSFLHFNLFSLGRILKQTPSQFKNAFLGASSVLRFNYDWQSTRQLLRPQPSWPTRGSPQLLHHLTQTQFVYFSQPGIFRSLAWLHYHIYCSTGKLKPGIFFKTRQRHLDFCWPIFCLIGFHQ